MPIISYNSRMGLAKETAWGTAIAAPTAFLPFKTLKSEDDIKRIVDSAKRGNLTKDFASYAGVMSAKNELDADVYPDTIGNVLLALFGLDTVTGASAPYTHKFTLAANQPPSYTLFDYDGINERFYAGAVLQELALKFTSEGELTKQIKFMAKAGAVGTPHTATFSTVAPFIGFQASLTIAGTANIRCIGGDLAFKRDVKFTFGANNSQNPTKVNVSTVEVTGKLDFEVDDYTELNYYLNTTQPTTVVTFTSGTNTLTITMTKCDFEKVQGLDRTQPAVRVNASIRALYNVTDAGPCQVSLVNGIATY